MQVKKEAKVWIAIQTATRREKSVETMLIYKGYNCLLPRYRPAQREPQAVHLGPPKQTTFSKG